MFRHSWCVLVFAACGFSQPNPVTPAQAYCGVAQWDRSLLLAELGSFTDRPRLGEMCLRFTRDGDTFELVDELSDITTAVGLCRMKGTLSGSTATVTEGECRYASSVRSGRLFDLRGSFTFLEGQTLSLTLNGKTEEIGSVRALVNGAFVERDGFPQAATGTVTARYELSFQPRDFAPVVDPIPAPTCPSTVEGCYRTVLTPNIVVNASEPECQAVAAELTTTDFTVTSKSINGLDAVKSVSSCFFVADEGTALSPATFKSFEVDFADGGTSIHAWTIRDVNRGGFPIHCEVAFTGAAPTACN